MSFDFWGKPDFEPAELPDPPAILTAAVRARRSGRRGLAGVARERPRAARAVAEKQKVPVYEATPDYIFTKPDTVKKAIAAAP